MPDGQAADQARGHREAGIPGDRRGAGDLRPAAAAPIAPDVIDQIRRPVAGRQQHLDPLLPEQRREAFGVGGALQGRDSLLVDGVGEGSSRLGHFEDLLTENDQFLVGMRSIEGDQIGQGSAIDLRWDRASPDRH